MYTCGICGGSSRPGQARMTHVIYRTIPAGVQMHRTVTDGRTHTNYVETPTRTEIEREIPVCVDCKRKMHHGSTYEGLSAIYALALTEEMTQAAPVPEIPPPPPPTINQVVKFGRFVPNHKR